VHEYLARRQLSAGRRNKIAGTKSAFTKAESWHRQPKFEYRTARFLAKHGSDPSAMLTYDHLADRQSQRHPTWLRRNKRIKNSLNLAYIESRPSILDRYGHVVATPFGRQTSVRSIFPLQAAR
jgi:hypothetical protein